MHERNEQRRRLDPTQTRRFSATRACTSRSAREVAGGARALGKVPAEAKVLQILLIWQGLGHIGEVALGRSACGDGGVISICSVSIANALKREFPEFLDSFLLQKQMFSTMKSTPTLLSTFNVVAIGRASRSRIQKAPGSINVACPRREWPNEEMPSQPEIATAASAQREDTWERVV